MEQGKEGLLAALGQKQRKKLQKIVAKDQTNTVTKDQISIFTKDQVNTACRFDSSASSPAGTSTESSRPSTWTQPRPPPLPPKDRERSSPRREGRRHERQPPRESLEQYPRQTVPNASRYIAPKPHLHSSSSSESTKPSTPKMRGRVQAPVSAVGQMDFPLPPRRVLSRMSSVDLIAEQYRALLESRPSSLYSDDYSEPALSPDVSDTEPPTMLQRHRSSSYLERHSRITNPPPIPELPKPSPASDDGTLVSFQDETVYFKPLSFSPEPPAQPPARESPALAPPPLSRQSTSTTAGDENIPLQICLDLLKRELTTAFSGRSTSLRTASLQVWAMIEAYEGLRDKMRELSEQNPQARKMEGMFELWLRALYAVHHQMTGEDKGNWRDWGVEFEGENSV